MCYVLCHTFVSEQISVSKYSYISIIAYDELNPCGMSARTHSGVERCQFGQKSDELFALPVGHDWPTERHRQPDARASVPDDVAVLLGLDVRARRMVARSASYPGPLRRRCRRPRVFARGAHHWSTLYGTAAGNSSTAHSRCHFTQQFARLCGLHLENSTCFCPLVRLHLKYTD